MKRKLIFSHYTQPNKQGEVAYIYENGSDRETKIFADHYEAMSFAASELSGFTPPLSYHLKGWTSVEVLSVHDPEVGATVTGVYSGNPRGLRYEDLKQTWDKMAELRPSGLLPLAHKEQGRLNRQAASAAMFSMPSITDIAVNFALQDDFTEAVRRLGKSLEKFGQTVGELKGFAKHYPTLSGFKPCQPSTLMGDHPGRTKATNKRRKYLKAGFTEAEIKSLR